MIFSKLTKKHYFIALGVILILTAVSLSVYKFVYVPAKSKAADAALSQNSQTAVVQKGNLSIYARGIGTLGASNETKLGFGTNGVIADIMVKVGDKVTMGDILAVQSGR